MIHSHNLNKNKHQKRGNLLVNIILNLLKNSQFVNLIKETH